MDRTWNGSIENTGRDDDVVVSEPKSGGLDRMGGGKDDDDVVVSEPKSGGLDRTGR
jgi:hypothetical protein